MSVLLIHRRQTWKQVLEGKARLLHQQIAALQRWVEEARGGEKMLEELSAPYYALLHSIYEEDFPLAFQSVSPISRISSAQPARSRNVPKQARTSVRKKKKKSL